MELLAPGVIFLWLAIASGIVGFILLAIPEISWQTQFLLFSVLSIVSAAIGRQLYKRHDKADDHQDLNQRSAQYIGRILTLSEPVVNGISRAYVDDTTWSVRCNANLAKGEMVKVISVDGIIMQVEPFHPTHETPAP